MQGVGVGNVMGVYRKRSVTIAATALYLHEIYLLGTNVKDDQGSASASA